MSRQPSFFESFVKAAAATPFGGEVHDLEYSSKHETPLAPKHEPQVAPPVKAATAQSKMPRAQSFFKHSVANPFDSLRFQYPDPEITEEDAPSIASENPKLFKNFMVGATQVGFNSGAWFAATAATLGLISTNSIYSFLEMVKKNPGKFIEGSQWLVPYNMLIAGVTTKAQVAAQGDDHSPLGVFRGVVAGTTAETLVGNIFDYKSLQNLFLIAKINATPGVFEKLDLKQLRALLPESKASSREGLLQEITDHPSRVVYRGGNLKMLQEVTGVRLTHQDAIKANAAMTLPSALRNSYFYLLLAYNKKTESEGNSLTPLELATGSIIGAGFTFIPNAVTYGAAEEVMKGKAILESLKNSISSFKPGSGSTMSPMQAAAVFSVRALVMYVTTRALTKDSEEKIGKAVDAVFGKTSEEMDREVEKIINDPATVTKAVKECEVAIEILDAAAVGKTKSEMEKKLASETATVAAANSAPSTSTEKASPAKKLASQGQETKDTKKENPNGR
jgi:hypothetical protein